MHAIMHVYVHVTWDKRILFEAYEGKSSHWDDCVPHHSATLWLCNEVGAHQPEAESGHRVSSCVKTHSIATPTQKLCAPSQIRF